MIDNLITASCIASVLEKQSDLETEVAAFVTTQLPIQGTPLGNHWTEMLYASFPKVWDIVQARAVGQWRIQNPTVLAEILVDLCTGEPLRFRRNFIAIDEAIRQGGSNIVTQHLMELLAQ